MDENKTAFKVALGALVALAVVAALWRVLAYEPGTSAAAPRTRAYENTAAPAVASPSTKVPVTQQDFLSELLPEEASLAETSAQKAPVHYVPNPSVRPTAYPQNRASQKTPYPATSAPRHRYVQNNFYNSSKPVPATQQAHAYRSAAGPVTGGAVPSSFSSQAMQEERARMLAPYLQPNRKQKEQMDEKWAKLSAAIDRAVLQALTPKSKKEQMLEKYAPQQAAGAAAAAQESGLTGPFAAVTNAISAQKNDIVKSFAQAFGSSAGQQAGSLMDSFASEVAAAASAPNVSAQQAAQQVKAIAQKYQQKMDKLEQKSQYDKFVAERVAQDNQQKEELGALYPQEKAQIAQLIDQTREKDLALATQNLPRETYFNQLAQHNQALRSGIEKLVAQGGKSAQDFHQWEEKNTQQYLEKLNALEEAGQIQSVATAASADERQRTQSEVRTQGEDIKKNITAAFGEQAWADFEPILKNYEQARTQIDQAKLSPLDRAKQTADVIKQANRQLVDQKIRTVEKMDIPDEQKQALVEKFRQEYDNYK